MFGYRIKQLKPGSADDWNSGDHEQYPLFPQNGKRLENVEGFAELVGVEWAQRTKQTMRTDNTDANPRTIVWQDIHQPRYSLGHGRLKNIWGEKKTMESGVSRMGLSKELEKYYSV